MKKLLIMALLSCSFAVGYSVGEEDGRDDYVMHLLNEGSLLDAIAEAETALLRIQHTPNGYDKIDEHLNDAFFWLNIAKDLEYSERNGR